MVCVTGPLVNCERDQWIWCYSTLADIVLTVVVRRRRYFVTVTNWRPFSKMTPYFPSEHSIAWTAEPICELFETNQITYNGPDVIRFWKSWTEISANNDRSIVWTLLAPLTSISYCSLLSWDVNCCRHSHPPFPPAISTRHSRPPFPPKLTRLTEMVWFNKIGAYSIFTNAYLTWHIGNKSSVWPYCDEIIHTNFI